MRLVYFHLVIVYICMDAAIDAVSQLYTPGLLERFMSYHLTAWSSSNAAGPAEVVPVPDGIMTISNAHILPQQDASLIFAAGMSALLLRVQIVTATLRQITSPFITPLIGAAVPGSTINISDYRRRPLLLKRLEEIQLLATNSGAGPSQTTVLAGLAFGGIAPAPNGTPFTLRGVSTTAAVANAWSQITITWQDVLPMGVYSVVGMRHISTNGQGARIIFEGQYYRPGVISQAADVNQFHPMFMKGEIGEFGRFDYFHMPNVEVLCNGADAAHTVYLDIVKVS
jgi:hypothetical protein